VAGSREDFPEVRVEFGTGLRARLEERRIRFPLVLVSDSGPTSPELALVSPELPVGSWAASAFEWLERPNSNGDRVPLGRLVREAGLLRDDDVEQAVREAFLSRRRLGEVLTERGHVTEKDLIRLLADQRGLPFVELRSLEIDDAAARLLPGEVAWLKRTLPIGFARGLPVVAVPDPTDDGLMQELRSSFSLSGFVASLEQDILTSLARVYAEDEWSSLAA
jgi:hypothetical protein